VPSLDGQQDFEIYVPSVSQPDELLKLSGKGLKSAIEDQVGDYLVRLKIRWPKKLSDKQKDLYESLKRIGT
jgi:DnaJ-class molecular chaperone